MSVRPTMPRGITAITWRVQLPTLWLCYIAEDIISHYLISIKCYNTVLFNYWWSQALTRILPNRHLWGPMYTHYVTWISDNFGPRQILVIAIRGTFAFWHADISSFHRKLALSAWDQNLREKSSASALVGGWWGAVSKRAKILNQRVDSVNGEVKHHHHEGIEFRGSILTTPFLCEADSSHIFLVILTPNTPNMVPGAKDTMTGWTVQPIKKDRFVWDKKADHNFKRSFHFCIL